MCWLRADLTDLAAFPFLLKVADQEITRRNISTEANLLLKSFPWCDIRILEGLAVNIVVLKRVRIIDHHYDTNMFIYNLHVYQEDIEAH